MLTQIAVRRTRKFTNPRLHPAVRLRRVDVPSTSVDRKIGFPAE
jgi:hypothetical protein